MTTLIYNTGLQQLQGFGKTWKVRSGIPGLYTPIPRGTYTAPHGSLMTGNSSGIGVPYHVNFDKSSYEDKMGLRWFLWLGIGNYGIHPDGTVPGTRGCIGIVKDDTSDLFHLLKSAGSITVIVQ